MKILRKTKSVCPECLEEIDADIINSEGRIYMTKRCKKHGSFKTLLAGSSRYYDELHNYYFTLNELGKDVSKKCLKPFILLYLTLKCNLNCPICFTRSNKTPFKEPDLESIKEYVSQYKKTEIIPFGGEPTIRDDLPDIIRIIKKSNNIPIVFTNGIRLSDINYLKELKKAGLEQVRYSFLGFNPEYYRIIEGTDACDKKIKALENLKKLEIPTSVECTICNDLNDKEMKKLLDYSINNTHVKVLVFRAYAFLGNKGLSKQDYGSNPVDLIRKFEAQTGNKINEGDFIEFQKLLFAMSDALKIKICFYQPYLLLWRSKGTYKTINELFPLKKIQKRLDRYLAIRKKSHWKAKVYLFLNILPRLVRFKNLEFCLNSLLVLLFKTFNLSKTSNKLMLLIFPVNCDTAVYDKTISNNCTADEFKFDGPTVNLATANMMREKKQNEAENNMQ